MFFCKKKKKETINGCTALLILFFVIRLPAIASELMKDPSVLIPPEEGHQQGVLGGLGHDVPFPLIVGLGCLLKKPLQDSYNSKNLTEDHFITLLETSETIFDPYSVLRPNFINGIQSQLVLRSSVTSLICFEKAIHHCADLARRQFGIHEDQWSPLVENLPPFPKLSILRKQRSGRVADDWEILYKDFVDSWSARKENCILDDQENPFVENLPALVDDHIDAVVEDLIPNNDQENPIDDHIDVVVEDQIPNNAQVENTVEDSPEAREAESIVVEEAETTVQVENTVEDSPEARETESIGVEEAETTVPPSQRTPTNSLRIDQFLRPFTLKAVQELLGKTGNVTCFWMDQIKTHCYVTYSSIEEATDTRNAVYNLQWPPNGGRLLVAEYVDPEEVKMKLEAPPTQAPSISSVPTVPPVPPSSLLEPSHHQHREQKHPVPASPPPPPPPLSRSLPAVTMERLPSPPPLAKKVDPTIVTLDDLFCHTTTTPRIYYLPLSEEQVAAKLAAQGKRMRR